MQIDTLINDGDIWKHERSEIADRMKAGLVMVFGDTDTFKQCGHYERLKEIYPHAHIVGASSSGNIQGAEVSTHPLIASVVRFDSTRIETARIGFEIGDDVEALSESLISQLPKEGLRHIFILSDGLLINGSELVRGVNKAAWGVTVSGGMAGDGRRFAETYIIADAPASQRCVCAVGFYGENLRISSGCFAGWSEFGTDRTITRSVGNVVYEIDGEPALDLYQKYLGDYAADLPNSGLRFPLSIKAKMGDPEVIRTLLAIDEEARSITFAGDVPAGYHARLMKPDVDALIEGAEFAAKEIDQPLEGPGLGLVVSCVGRKIIMNQLVDEELEAVQGVLGESVHLCGFYSYGEIAPFASDLSTCQLHNQTMTLTVLYES